MSFCLVRPNNAAGGTEAAHASLIMYTQLVAAFMIEDDILSVTLWRFSSVTVQGWKQDE